MQGAGAGTFAENIVVADTRFLHPTVPYTESSPRATPPLRLPRLAVWRPSLAFFSDIAYTLMVATRSDQLAMYAVFYVALYRYSRPGAPDARMAFRRTTADAAHERPGRARGEGTLGSNLRAVLVGRVRKVSTTGAAGRRVTTH